MRKIMLVKYGEVALRQGNRGYYERQIMDDIRRRIKDLHRGNIRVFREQGRFLIEDLSGDLDTAVILPRIQHIFGAIAFCDGVKTTERCMEALEKIAVAFFRDKLRGTSFKVHTKRADKRFPLTSNEVSAEIGGLLLDALPNSRVDLHNPDTTFRIEIRNHIYFYVDSTPGEGGLPYGSAGKGILLLSGGIDSPIAGYLAAKRGVELIPLYFHSPPYVSERVTDKVSDLLGALKPFIGDCPLNIVPFTDIQLYLQENIPAEKFTILLKRAMLHIASTVAAQKKAHCLITGDSVGQVASQTLHSLAAVNAAATLPILRPLTAMDKQQIIDIAHRLGTYPISIRPYEDCCTLFVAKHPENKPNTQVIERMESRLMNEGLSDLLKKATENIQGHNPA